MPEFVDTTPAHQCLFCRLIAGEIPSAKVYEDAQTVAFMDIGQVNPGHVLVAPKRHAATLLECSAEDASAMMHTAHRIAQAIQKAFNPPGLMLLQANGAVAGQTVGHVHMHVVPRHNDDGLSFTWPRPTPGPDALAAYAQQLAQALELA